jgi:hypothetical protein
MRIGNWPNYFFSPSLVASYLIFAELRRRAAAFKRPRRFELESRHLGVFTLLTALGHYVRAEDKVG